MAIRLRDLHIHDGLSIVRLDGFEPAKGHDGGDAEIDPLGGANWFQDQYGLSDEVEGDEPGDPGILWSDYDGEGWEFSVLVDSAEVDAVKELAAEHGYSVLSVSDIDEPTCYGDGHQGTVEILRHRDGWVLIRD